MLDAIADFHLLSVFIRRPNTSILYTCIVYNTMMLLVIIILSTFDVQRWYIYIVIGVIYGGTRGTSTSTPTFWTGVPYPYFSGWKMKNFLSCAVNSGDLRKLNYNKTVFGPHWENSQRFPRPRIGRRGIPPSHFPPLSSWDPRTPPSPSEVKPHFWP